MTNPKCVQCGQEMKEFISHKEVDKTTAEIIVYPFYRCMNWDIGYDFGGGQAERVRCRNFNLLQGNPDE